MKKRINFCPLYQQWYKKTSLIAGSLSSIGYGNQQPRINSFLINKKIILKNINIKDIEKACELKIQGYKNAEISRLLNISLDTLHKVFNGKQWKEVYELYENELIKVQRLSKPRD